MISTYVKWTQFFLLEIPTSSSIILMVMCGLSFTSSSTFAIFLGVTASQGHPKQGSSFNTLILIFECFNPPVNSGFRECIRSFSNPQLLVNLFRCLTVFPANIDVIALMFLCNILH